MEVTLHEVSSLLADHWSTLDQLLDHTKFFCVLRIVFKSIGSKKENEKVTMSNQMQFAPFREMSDAIGQAQNYAIPELADLSRLSNRITNNLLYYQTNYLVFFLLIFFIIG